MKPTLDELKQLVTRLRSDRYAEADVIFLAGSVVRGEGTKTSDLDLVVAYDTIPNAYRDSYHYGGWPVEVFVHDLQTFEYFMHKVDVPVGVPELATMVSEGVELPLATDLSRRFKQAASQSLEAGPPKWADSDIDNSRYVISDLIEDIKDPRNQGEMYATASQLYSAISNHYFRSKGLWSAKGKSIPRQLHKVDQSFALRFDSAFGAVFVQGDTSKLMALALEVVSESGGFLFDGHRVEAPVKWKIE